MLQREWGVERATIREQTERLPMQIEKAQDTFAKAQSDNLNAKKVAAMEELHFDNKRLHAEITRAVANFKKGDDTPIPLGTLGGFAIAVETAEVGNGLSLDNYTTEIVARITVQGEAAYSCEAGRNETDNNVVRLKNVFASIIPKREESAASEITRLTENLEQAKSQIDVPFEYADKIVELEKELEVLNARLSCVFKGCWRNCGVIGSYCHLSDYARCDPPLAHLLVGRHAKIIFQNNRHTTGTPT